MTDPAGRTTDNLINGQRLIDAGAIMVILLAGLLIRITAWLYAPHIIHADETFQYIEQGFRLVSGRGAIPWEYLEGIRSWILPGIVSGIILGSAALDIVSTEHLFSIRFVAISSSLIPIYVTFHVIRRHHSLIAASTGALIVTLWFEAIYFSSAILTEVISAHILLLGLYIGRGLPNTDRGLETARCIAAGALLALALSLRFHYGPGILLAGMALAGRDRRRWYLLGCGGGTVLFLFGLLDWITLGLPFQSIYLNFVRNIVDGVASGFGREPTTYFLSNFWWIWGAAVLALPLALIGLKQWPTLGIVSVAILASHTLVAHKEYRHVYFVLISIVACMGFGAANVIDRFQNKVSRLSAAAVILLAISVLSYWSGTTGLMRDRWANQRPMIQAFAMIAQSPDVCGLAVKGIDPWATLGYAYFIHDAPLFFDHASAAKSTKMKFMEKSENRWHDQLIDRDQGLNEASVRRLFNFVIAPEGYDQPEFERISCFRYPTQTHPRSAICVWQRPGSCGLR